MTEADSRTDERQRQGASAAASFSDSLDVWGGGELLAFSGLDGPTDFETQLVGRTSFAGCGIDIKLPSAQLWGQCPHQCVIRFDDVPPRRARLAGDFFELEVAAGTVRGAFLDNEHLLIDGPCRLEACSPAIRAVQRDGRTLIASHAKDNAALLDADLPAVMSARAEWLASALARLRADRLTLDRRRLLAKCLSIMKTQVYTPQGRIRRRWTTADRWPHRRMFLWDSVFHAMGLRHIDVQLAREAIHALLDVQQPDGMIGHTHDGGFSSKLTQPPVLTMGAMRLDEMQRDDAWLAEIYPHLRRYIEWDLTCDVAGGGLLQWRITDSQTCRCDESGADNSSRFDCAVPLDAPDFSAFVARECELLAQMADRLGRRDDARRWAAHHRRLNELMNARLWSEELGFYVDAVAADGRQTGILATSGFFPLLSGAPSLAQAHRLAEHVTDPRTFGAPLPLPTIAACHQADGLYEKDMWRGPVWMNYNWLAAEGFDRYGLHDVASLIRNRSLDAVWRYYQELGCLFEFYDDRLELPPPQLHRKKQRIFDTHPHMVIHDYGWTAACCADWICRGF
jgi:glycogen debranching enzyme